MVRRILLLLVMMAFGPSSALALSSDWEKDDAVSVRLISGVDAVGVEEVVPLGLEIQLAEGWHTYWRSPGEAGLPPRLDWQNSMTESGNVQDAVLLYPAPKRYVAYGLETVGYREHVVFPINVKLQKSGKALAVDASLDLLVCSSICVPKNFTLKLTVPSGQAVASVEASLIKPFRDAVPNNTEQSGLVIQSIINDGQRLIITIQSRDTMQSPDIFVEDEKNISFSAPETTLSPDLHSATFRLKSADTLSDDNALSGMPLTLTIVDDDRATEQNVITPPVSVLPSSQLQPAISFSLAVLFAFIGGLILNLMPCVLPVLSLKILSVVSHGGGNPRNVRYSFLVTAIGILFSFIVLALTTIALRSVGLTFGWGVQFQQPGFLTFLILLVTIFAANMWELFAIPLPRWLADNLPESSFHPKLAHDFFSGAFATLLATPCTAPFLGTAIGFALASGPFEVVSIFSALGSGMIVPYVAVALYPRVVIALPKPGPWMVTLRNGLGWALALTALWLLWVLAAQITTSYAVFVGASMVGIVILLTMYRKTTISKSLIKLGLLIFVLAAFWLTLAGADIPKSPSVDTLWLPFDERAIAADVEEGKTVFVDVTADWCLTCKANKKFILSQGDVERRLFHSNIIAMQADWTNPDPRVTKFLHKYGRYGIPFNIVFGPGASQGIALSELLTSADVLDALTKASQQTSP
jgi:suppressor for copper-sensitivity B